MGWINTDFTLFCMVCYEFISAFCSTLFWLLFCYTQFGFNRICQDVLTTNTVRCTSLFCTPRLSLCFISVCHILHLSWWKMWLNLDQWAIQSATDKWCKIQLHSKTYLVEAHFCFPQIVKMAIPVLYEWCR